MSEQHTFRPDSWQARGHRIAELERRIAGAQAGIRGRSGVIDECMRTIDDLERQRAAMQAANEQLRAALVVAQQAIADIRNLNAHPRIYVVLAPPTPPAASRAVACAPAWCPSRHRHARVGLDTRDRFDP